MKYMFTIFEDFAEGAEFYRNNGSIWLIFTKDKRWVIELTKQGTLWYNYYFFHKIFNLLGMDIEENQHTITEWVEYTIQNGVKATEPEYIEGDLAMEEVIQNGVKRTVPESIADSFAIEDTIQNGVKHTEYGDWLDGDERLDEIIQNGIKETRLEQNITEGEIDDIIQNGINETWGYEKQPQNRIYEVIKNGIKEIPS